MQRRTALLFVIFNVILSVGVAFGVIALLNARNADQPNFSQVITVEFVITATPGATQTPFIITSTPPEGVVLLPTGLFGTQGVPPVGTPGTLAAAGGVRSASAATIDPTLLSGDAALQSTASVLPDNCILHTLVEGDTPFSIAEQYGADGFDLLAVNGLDDEGARLLQIGQVLIVPLEGCALVAAAAVAVVSAETAEVTEAAEPTITPTSAASTAAPVTPTITRTATPTATTTLPPTAQNAQMEILSVQNAGSVTAEYVEIRNNGATVSLDGWTIRDSDGDEYAFTEQLLFTQGRLRVYTGVGQNVPTSQYWGRQQAVYDSGDSVTLLDADGRVQSTFVIP